MPPKKKKIAALVKVQLTPGAATPRSPGVPRSAPHGVDMMEFCKAYNAAHRASAAGHPGGDHRLRGPQLDLVTKTPGRQA